MDTKSVAWETLPDWLGDSSRRRFIAFTGQGKRHFQTGWSGIEWLISIELNYLETGLVAGGGYSPLHIMSWWFSQIAPISETTSLFLHLTTHSFSTVVFRFFFIYFLNWVFTKFKCENKASLCMRVSPLLWCESVPALRLVGSNPANITEKGHINPYPTNVENRVSS